MSRLTVLLLATPLLAHNGDVAIAVPVEGIVVDGDLSDWPERTYEILGSPGDSEGLLARVFQVEVAVCPACGGPMKIIAADNRSLLMRLLGILRGWGVGRGPFVILEASAPW